MTGVLVEFSRSVLFLYSIVIYFYPLVRIFICFLEIDMAETIGFASIESEKSSRLVQKCK